MTGLVGWALIFAAALVWEGLGLVVGPPWPTLSHLLRDVTRSIPGRLILFGLWLWVGWHLFIRGWDFFLRGPLPEPPSAGQGAGLGLSQIWQRAILPLTGIYVLFLAMLGVMTGRRAPAETGTGPGGRDALAPKRSMRKDLGRALVTVVGGYVVFVALIGAYVLAGGSDRGGLLGHAIRGGALLAFGVVVPGFTVVSGLARTRARVCRGRSASIG